MGNLECERFIPGNSCCIGVYSNVICIQADKDKRSDIHYYVNDPLNPGRKTIYEKFNGAVGAFSLLVITLLEKDILINNIHFLSVFH